MKFLMISNVGEGSGLLKQIELEGNEVELHIVQEPYRRVWNGMMRKVDVVEPSEGTVVIFDFSGMGKLADELREAGFSVLGGSKFADKLEQDRMFGLNFMEEAGIKVPLTANFDKFGVDQIKEFLEEHGKNRRFVFKPSGKDLPCFLTYCSRDSEDLLKWSEYVDEYFGKDVESFVLQEFKEGVCVSTEAWCDGMRFVRPFNHTVEVKHLMNGDLGQATGCSGNLVWAEHDESCRIVAEGIAKTEELVVGSGYVGPIDLNAVVNEEGVWGLEFTPRFGYDAMPAFVRLVRGDGVARLISDVARGQGGNMTLLDQVAASIRVSIPPYPLDPEDVEDVQDVCPNIGVPVRIDGDDWDGFYFFEVEEDSSGGLVHSVGTGVIASVVGLGEDAWDALEEPYELLEKLVLPNKQYRTDLDHVLGEMFEDVEEYEGNGGRADGGLVLEGVGGGE